MYARKEKNGEESASISTRDTSSPAIVINDDKQQIANYKPAILSKWTYLGLTIIQVMIVRN